MVQVNNKTQQGNITLFCSFGKLDAITLFGQSLLKQNVSCSNDGAHFVYSPPKCDYTDFSFLDNTTYSDYLDTLFEQQCEDKVVCNFIFN